MPDYEKLNQIMTTNLSMTNAKTSLAEVAKKSLEQNIVKLESGLFLSAGANQFKSFWTRDFCFSVRGLLAINRADVVKNHLNYLITHRRQDNLVPLYVDSMSPVNRVISSVFFKTLHLNATLPMKNNIKPFYLVNGKFEAIDSNLMVLYASQLYLKNTEDTAWFETHREDFKKIFDFYNSKKSGLLINQAEHADWQDSARRKGIMFFTNLLYYHMAQTYDFMNETQLLELKNKIIEVFYDKQTGLFRSMAGRENISLEGNLWAIEHNLITNRDLLYKNLIQHPLYTLKGMPGFPTYPSYTKKDTYIQVKVVGLQEYHGQLYWSWLMAYSAKIALLMQDYPNYTKIRALLEKIANRDHVVNEIYHANEEYTPFNSMFYKSEAPFSWGSAFILDLEIKN